MKKISIIGASSYIGRRLYSFFKSNKGDFKVEGTYYSNKSFPELTQLNVTNFTDLEFYLKNNDFDFVILLSGIKDVKKCELNYNLAYNLNVRPISYIIDIVKKNNFKTGVIFMSSDYVFDGMRGDYSDKDKPNPNTNYGKTKFLAEQELLKSGINYKIVRTSAVMGKGGVFFDWIIKEFNKSNEIELFSNVYFTPTPLLFLCEMIYNLIIQFNSVTEKILHIVGERKMSRYEFGNLIYEIYKNNLNFKSTPNLVPKEMNFTNTFFQKDLSMLHSNFVKINQIRKLEDYLEEEIEND